MISMSARVVLKAWISSKGRMARTPDEGSRILRSLWIGGVDYVVVKYEGNFYTICLDNFKHDDNAYLFASDYTVHGDEDAAIAAAALQWRAA